MAGFEVDEDPRAFVMLAAAVLVFAFGRHQGVTAAGAFDAAEDFVAEAEKRFGPLGGSGRTGQS